MMKLFIDGKQADTDQTTAVSISLGIASITKIETGRIFFIQKWIVN